MSKERNQNLVKEVRKRDNNTCQRCEIYGDDVNFEVHHIVSLNPYGEDEAENMITLCPFCHKFAPNDKEEFYKYLNDMDYLSLKLVEVLNNEEKELLLSFMEENYISNTLTEFITICYTGGTLKGSLINTDLSKIRNKIYDFTINNEKIFYKIKNDNLKESREFGIKSKAEKCAEIMKRATEEGWSLEQLKQHPDYWNGRS